MQPLTEEQRRQKKFELLSKLQALERKGVGLTKKFTTKHRLCDIQSEYDRVHALLTEEAGVKFGRKVLMAFVSGVEYANKSFDPVGAKLEGWSESVMENVEDYDNSLAKLANKWQSRVEVAPEMELFIALSGSAFMFHLSKSLLQNSGSFMKSMETRAPNMLERMMKGMMSRPSSKTRDLDDEVSESEDITPPLMNLNPLESDDSSVGTVTVSDGSSGYESSEASSKRKAPKARIFTVPNKNKK